MSASILFLWWEFPLQLYFFGFDSMNTIFVCLFVLFWHLKKLWNMTIIIICSQESTEHSWERNTIETNTYKFCFFVFFLNQMLFHSSSVTTYPVQGCRRELKPIPANTGHGQGIPWTSCQFITGLIYGQTTIHDHIHT